MPVVEVENLSRSFGDNLALDGLSFTVEEGEIFGLVGPDGAGKTTCLRLLCGLMEPSGGRAMVLGRDVAREPEAVKQQIGYMAQPAGLYPDLTVNENIEFYAELYHVPAKQYKERTARLLEFSGLAPFTRRLFRDLSGGMKQKVGLTCALIHTPKVLFLDEPTNGVDPISRRDFWKILYELKRDRVTIVVASTYLDEADRCHRVALFDRGQARLVMEPLAMRGLLTGQLYNVTVADRHLALKVLKGLPLVSGVQYLWGRHPCLTGRGRASPATDQGPGSGRGHVRDRRTHRTHSGRRIPLPAGGWRQLGATIVIAVYLKDAVKRFGDFTAVDHISLEVNRGEIFGFLGPNGAGKSTTIRMLCGLLTPTSGEGRVNGLDIRTQSEEIKAQLGYMSQKFSLYDDLRVEENMSFFGGIYGLNRQECSRRIGEVLAQINLSDRRQTLTRDLPGGLKQRLALGCALLHKPPIIFLDEPTSGVDPATRRNFWDLIYALADDGVTMFVTTHYMEEAEYCNRIGLIDQGRLIALGSPDHLKKEHLSGRVYEVETSDVLAAVEALSGQAEVLDAAVFGRTMHVRLDGEVPARDFLTRELSAAGLTTDKIKQIEPTLEDVFVALVGKKLVDNK